MPIGYDLLEVLADLGDCRAWFIIEHALDEIIEGLVFTRNGDLYIGDIIVKEQENEDFRRRVFG